MGFPTAWRTRPGSRCRCAQPGRLQKVPRSSWLGAAAMGSLRPGGWRLASGPCGAGLAGPRPCARPPGPGAHAPAPAPLRSLLRVSAASSPFCEDTGHGAQGSAQGPLCHLAVCKDPVSGHATAAGPELGPQHAFFQEADQPMSPASKYKRTGRGALQGAWPSVWGPPHPPDTAAGPAPLAWASGLAPLPRGRRPCLREGPPSCLLHLALAHFPPSAPAPCPTGTRASATQASRFRVLSGPPAQCAPAQRLSGPLPPPLQESQGLG